MDNGSLRGRHATLIFLLVASLSRCVLAGLLDDGAFVPSFATKYAPLVNLHSEDPFRPSDMYEHIRHSTPRLDFAPVQGLPPLDLDNLDILNGLGTEVALTSNDDILDLPPWLLGELPDESGRIHNSTPCVVILVEKTPQDVDVYYFYFYSYDRGANGSQVLEPLDSWFDLNETQRAMHYGDHVGDWENNMVRFKHGEPTGIYYSQHVSGEVYKWDDEKLEKDSGRPIVYSAYGSHANYASAGNHVHDKVLMDYCDAGPRWDPIQSAYHYHLDPNTFKLTRLFHPNDADTTSNYTSFFYYTGRWGDQQYSDSDPRQVTIPYFKLKRFETGPTGPRNKQLIRKGMFPDHQHVGSWTEWGIGVYMSLYPCCLKGWRIYLSVVAIITVFAGLIIGLILGVKVFGRRRGYKKVDQDTDIPLLDTRNRGSLESSRSIDEA